MFPQEENLPRKPYPWDREGKPRGSGTITALTLTLSWSTCHIRHFRQQVTMALVCAAWS